MIPLHRLIMRIVIMEMCDTIINDIKIHPIEVAIFKKLIKGHCLRRYRFLQEERTSALPYISTFAMKETFKKQLQSMFK